MTQVHLHTSNRTTSLILLQPGVALAKPGSVLSEAKNWSKGEPGAKYLIMKDSMKHLKNIAALLLVAAGVAGFEIAARSLSESNALFRINVRKLQKDPNDQAAAEALRALYDENINNRTAQTNFQNTLTTLMPAQRGKLGSYIQNTVRPVANRTPKSNSEKIADISDAVSNLAPKNGDSKKVLEAKEQLVEGAKEAVMVLTNGSPDPTTAGGLKKLQDQLHNTEVAIQKDLENPKTPASSSADPAKTGEAAAAAVELADNLNALAEGTPANTPELQKKEGELLDDAMKLSEKVGAREVAEEAAAVKTEIEKGLEEVAQIKKATAESAKELYKELKDAKGVEAAFKVLQGEVDTVYNRKENKRTGGDDTAWWSLFYRLDALRQKAIAIGGIYGWFRDAPLARELNKELSLVLGVLTELAKDAKAGLDVYANLLKTLDVTIYEWRELLQDTKTPLKADDINTIIGIYDGLLAKAEKLSGKIRTMSIDANGTESLALYARYVELAKAAGKVLSNVSAEEWKQIAQTNFAGFNQFTSAKTLCNHVNGVYRKLENELQPFKSWIHDRGNIRPDLGYRYSVFKFVAGNAQTYAEQLFDTIESTAQYCSLFNIKDFERDTKANELETDMRAAIRNELLATNAEYKSSIPSVYLTSHDKAQTPKIPQAPPMPQPAGGKAPEAGKGNADVGAIMAIGKIDTKDKFTQAVALLPNDLASISKEDLIKMASQFQTAVDKDVDDTAASTLKAINKAIKAKK